MARSTTSTKLYNLPPKKTLKIMKSLVHPSLYRIAFEEGGPVPMELSGEFNKLKVIQAFLASYLEKKEQNKSYLDFIRDKENAEKQDKVGV